MLNLLILKRVVVKEASSIHGEVCATRGCTVATSSLVKD